MVNYPIYHITHYQNLAGIIQSGGLHCDKGTHVYRNIGYGHIKERRKTHPIPCWKAVCLGDCVPFYFGCRSPMLYVIHSGGVENYFGGQRETIYLVSSTNLIFQSSLKWCFTDGHAVEVLTNYYTDDFDLDRLDWDSINARQWANSDENPDRKRKKQAEFLVQKFFPLQYIQKIGVFDDKMLETIGQQIDIPISKEPSWYY